MPLKNISSTQAVASSEAELRGSYNRLYQEWLGEQRSFGEAKQLLDVLHVGPGKLLDVACGLGYLMDMAGQRGASTYGLDISRVALSKSKSEDKDRCIVEGNGEFLPWETNTFDYVTCQGSLEHFIHPEVGAQEIARVLKPEGKAAIMLPNSHHVLAIYNVYKTGGILPELQDFERFGTRVEWHAFLEENGLKVESVHKFNIGFSRFFKKGREVFWYLYNSIYRTLGDIWIPTNLSFMLTFVCSKTNPSNEGQAKHAA